MAVNKEIVAMNLLTSTSYQECCDRSGISRRTLEKLRKKEEFQVLVDKLKKDMFRESMQKAQATSIKALNVLNEIMDDTTATDSARVSACRTVLELACSNNEQEEILRKLDELEGRVVNENY